MLRSTVIVAAIGSVFVAPALATIRTDAHVPFFALNTQRDTYHAPDFEMMNDEWASSWQTGDWTLCSDKTFVTPVENCTKICTHINGQMKIDIKYKKTDKSMHTTSMYIPASAMVNPEKSTCMEFVMNSTGDGYVYHTYDKGDSDEYKYVWASNSIQLDFYNESASLKLHFSNSTDLGSAGWMQWTIVQVEVMINTTSMSKHFPDIDMSQLDNNGLLYRNASGVHKDWWKKLSTRNFSSYDCHTLTSQDLGDGLTFSMQNMMLTALNADIFTEVNGTLEARMCNRDYEKDDGLAVLIGTIQTGFVILTLVIYLVYLSKRGPVKVPDWIVEPSMRNAQVKPITEQNYERKMSQVSGASLPQKRNAASADDKY